MRDFLDPRGFLKQHVKRTNRNLLMLSVGIVLGVLLIVVYSYRYLTADFRNGGYMVVAILAVVLLIAAWILRRWHHRVDDLKEHPVILWLGRFGDPFDVGNKIDAEISSGDCVGLGPLCLTREFMLVCGMFDVRVISVHELTWVYKRETEYSFNFIPVGSRCKLVYHTKTALDGEISMAEELVDRTILELFQRNPDARYGFHK